MIISNLSLLLYFSLLYIIGLTILYYSKARLKNIENRIYKWLLGLNILGIVLQLLCDYVSLHYYSVPRLLSDIIFRLYLAYFVAWVNTMLDYLLAIVFVKERRIVWLNIVFTVVETIVIMMLPFKLYRDTRNMIFYTYGLGINATFLLSGIIMTIMLILVLINLKKLEKKKIFPIFLFLFFGVMSSIIQNINPSIIIITSMETFICSLMYFTIENPDLKMIEQLNIARDQADKANQAKSDFLSSMSHEIRTPLNAIVGFSEALQEEDLPDKAQEEVKDIVMASNSLLEIVNGILDISKIESGKIEIVNSEYSFRELYDNLVALTKGRLGEKPLEIRTSYDESIPKVLYGDHTRIKQIILNILTNAVKYTKEGYIDFRVSSLVKDDICRLIISVEDSGIGIKQENIDKLFSRFERFDLDKNITIEGTGLGLAITKKLVDLMHGKIVVQSIYGKGSKFTIAIDQRIIHKEIVEEKKVNIDTFKNINVFGKKVLIVDDNKINLKVASRLLEGYNLNIETVDSGTLCLDKINSGCSYDLIFMDDMMPGLSGVETLQKLRENNLFNTPVIALTANAISGMKEKYISLGFNDYLSKPIDKEELKSIIIKYLNY